MSKHSEEIYSKLSDQESKDWFHARERLTLQGDDSLYREYFRKYNFSFRDGDIKYLTEFYPKEAKLLIFGTGDCGKYSHYILSHSELSSRILGFMDSHQEKWGGLMSGFAHIFAE